MSQGRAGRRQLRACQMASMLPAQRAGLLAVATTVDQGMGCRPDHLPGRRRQGQKRRPAGAAGSRGWRRRASAAWSASARCPPGFLRSSSPGVTLMGAHQQPPFPRLNRSAIGTDWCRARVSRPCAPQWPLGAAAAEADGQGHPAPPAHLQHGARCPRSSARCEWSRGPPAGRLAPRATCAPAGQALAGLSCSGLEVHAVCMQHVLAGTLAPRATCAPAGQAFAGLSCSRLVVHAVCMQHVLAGKLAP